jgi:hypothetical protein
MRVTNRSNLPEALVRAVENDPYNRGDAQYSVTQLLKPARMVALERIHKDELEEAVSDRIWALMGQLGHLVIERANIGVQEQRLFAVRNGLRVSGQLDLLNQGGGAWKSTDWKFTTVWSCKGGPKEEWEQQLNLGRWLAQENGIEVNELEIVALFRDWSKMDARRDRDYPQQQARTYKLPVWPMAKTLAFLDGRLAAHESAKQQLPDCTPEERWEKPTVYAVMKDGRKSAVKLHDHEEQARMHAEQLGKGHTVVTRPGMSTRCEAYCSVSRFCSFAQQTTQPNSLAA